MDRVDEHVIRRTRSVCPLCLRPVPAWLTARGSEVFLEKTCPEHGFFSAVTWRGEPDLASWTGFLPETDATRHSTPAHDDLTGSQGGIMPPCGVWGSAPAAGGSAPAAGEATPDSGGAPGCPWACGLCSRHRQSTCCVLLEVTERCNLRCAHCFAEAGDDTEAKDPPLDTVKGWITDIAGGGGAFLQLSGGEPTLRDDLPELVRHARQAGCAYVQLNSNGLRLASDEAYVEALAGAGLSFVFLQFDGTTDDIHVALRGRPLLEQKLRAIELCGRSRIGVTLVPTLVPGVNDHNVGDILRLAAASSPQVRGVHFQPISYFGRYPQAPDDARRITLPEVLRAMFDQAGDLVPRGSIAPSRCDHARCGFHGAYLALPEGLRPQGKDTGISLAGASPSPCCGDVTTAESNRRFVGLRWRRAPEQGCEDKALQSAACVEGSQPDGLDDFLRLSRERAFTVSAMAFQDAYTLDLERLRQCSLHVYAQGALIPFCAYYLNGAKALRRYARYPKTGQ